MLVQWCPFEDYRWLFAMNMEWSVKFTPWKKMGQMSFSLISFQSWSIWENKLIHLHPEYISNTSWMRKQGLLAQICEVVQSFSNSMKSSFSHPGGWGLKTTHFLPQFLHLQLTVKNSNSTKLIQIWSGGRVQVESKFETLQVIWQSLPKAFPEENQRS